MKATLARVFGCAFAIWALGASRSFAAEPAGAVPTAPLACPDQVTLWLQTAESVNEPTWKSALYEEAFRCQAADDLTRPGKLEGAAALAWRMLQFQLYSGLTGNVLAAFERLPPEVRARLTDGKALVLPSGGELPDLRLDLAAAYLVQGDPKAAGELLREIPEPGAESFYGGRFKPRIFWEVIARSLEPSAEDPFEFFAEAVSQLRHCSLTWLLATARLAEREGYPAMVSYATEKASQCLTFTDKPFTPAFDVPPRVRSAVEELKAERAALYQSLLRRAEPAREALGPAPQPALVSRLLGAPKRSRFAELPLSAGLERVEVAPRKERPLREAARAVEVPADFEVLRVGHEGNRAVAICVSRRYDPTAGISSGAYWVVLSSDGGATWSQPLYTGLREYQPYVVREVSSLPLFAGESLRIEVEIKELDTATIDFPAHSLAYKRSARRVFLEIPLASLMRDHDGDGLTDLAEERLLIDPDDPDTDGDGLPDAADPLPGVPWSREPSSWVHALAAAVAQISGTKGQDKDLTEFFVGDRALFSALHSDPPDERLVVLTMAEVTEATKKFGPFYPKKIELFLLDRAGRRGYVVWSWAQGGSEFSLEEKNGQWIAKEISSWAT